MSQTRHAPHMVTMRAFGWTVAGMVLGGALLAGAYLDAQSDVATLGDQVRGLGAVPAVAPAVPGVAGADGQDGAPGRDGRDGKDGAPGRDGVDGQSPPCLSEPSMCRGPAGPQGDPGRDGADGVDGADGADSMVPGPQGVSVTDVRAELRDGHCLLIFTLLDPGTGETREDDVEVGRQVCSDGGLTPPPLGGS